MAQHQSNYVCIYANTQCCDRFGFSPLSLRQFYYYLSLVLSSARFSFLSFQSILGIGNVRAPEQTRLSTLAPKSIEMDFDHQMEFFSIPNKNFMCLLGPKWVYKNKNGMGMNGAIDKSASTHSHHGTSVARLLPMTLFSCTPTAAVSLCYVRLILWIQ